MEELKKNKTTYHKEYYQKNKMKLLEYQKEYYQKNRMEIVEYQKAYHFRTNTYEKVLRQRAYNKEYYKKNYHLWNKRIANKKCDERPPHNSKKIKPIVEIIEPKKLSFWVQF
jgi:hypothetical protein